VNTKDAFAFFISVQFGLLFPKNGKERLRAISLKDALAFTKRIIRLREGLVNPVLQFYFCALAFFRFFTI
jgi:hypothetical protein